MKRSFLENLLKEKGVSDEDIKPTVDSIMNENGNDINAEKAKAESIKNDLKVKESLIEELNGKIKEATKTDIDAIKKEEYEKGKSEGQKEYDEFKRNNALKKAIKGAKDFDLVASKLDSSKITYEKNDKGEYEVSGVEEQLKNIKENYSYLFEDEKKNYGMQIDLGASHSGNSTNEAGSLRDALEEKYKM